MRKGKLKIQGVTGTPLWVARMQGYLDGRRRTAEYTGTEWRSHYIEGKKATCRAFVHKLYRELEMGTAPLYAESAQLVAELQFTRERLALPQDIPVGKTPSMLASNASRAAGTRSRLQSRQQEITLRLSAIEEEISHAANEAAGAAREASALVTRRVQAYLWGLSRAQHKPTLDIPLDLRHDFPEEDDFRARHQRNDAMRQAALGNIQKEAEPQ